MLDRQHLHIMALVAEKGTLTEAASALHLSQSALSHSIKKLEDDLGVALWLRDGRNIRLTEAGAHLVKTARRLLPQFVATEQALAGFAAGTRGELRIGMECHPCYRWLMQQLPGFMQQFPAIDIDIRQRFQFGGVAGLLNDEVDILLTPDPVSHARLVFVPVFDYELCLVTGKQHALASRPFVTPSDLTDEVLYTYPVPVERLDIFSQFLLPAGCVPRRHRTVETTDIMLLMAEELRGVTVLPAWLLEEYTQFEVVALSLGPQGLHKQLYAGYRQQPDATVQQFIRTLNIGV